MPWGAYLVDTPGVREIAVLTDEDAVASTFDDVAALAPACRFRDCAHVAEPGCAVLAAVASGRSTRRASRTTATCSASRRSSPASTTPSRGRRSGSGGSRSARRAGTRCAASGASEGREPGWGGREARAGRGRPLPADGARPSPRPARAVKGGSIGGRRVPCVPCRRGSGSRSSSVRSSWGRRCSGLWARGARSRRRRRRPSSPPICPWSTTPTSRRRSSRPARTARSSRRRSRTSPRAGEPAKARRRPVPRREHAGQGLRRDGAEGEDGTVIPYDPLAYPDFAEAQAALDALEKPTGRSTSRATTSCSTSRPMTADFLVRHVDNAFVAWRTSPAGQRVVRPRLPGARAAVPRQRGAGRGLARAAARALRREPPEAVVRASTPRAACDWVSGDVAARVRFDERYYLHPTDQGFAEMEKTGLGRCEDITNMTTYAARARGLATAADYTPAWGHRDNNHAWNVLLDRDGPRVATAATRTRRRSIARRSRSSATALPSGCPAGREAPNRFLAEQVVRGRDRPVRADDRRRGVLDPGGACGASASPTCACSTAASGSRSSGRRSSSGAPRSRRWGAGRTGCSTCRPSTTGRCCGPPRRRASCAKDGTVDVLAGTGAGATARRDRRRPPSR